MIHRARFQYSIRESDHLSFSLFTDSKQCKMPPKRPQCSMVIGKVCTYIPRASVADMLREARRNHLDITRHVDTFDTSEFCSRYCQKG